MKSIKGRERWLIENMPGPQNRDSFAGKALGYGHNQWKQL